LTATKNKDQLFFESYPRQKASLAEKIRRFAKPLGLAQDAIADLTNGQKVFVDGARGAAREAGLDMNYFEFSQSYLSAFVHSHPVSFMRAEEHKISCSTALAVFSFPQVLSAFCVSDMKSVSY
jgi:predicted NBD/HSP70 family sugar kinase